MGRYIDESKIKITADKTLADDDGAILLSLDDVRRSISQTPEEDVVKVVRCKDCKFYKASEKLAPTKFCYRLLDYDGKPVGYNFSNEDFCSYAERITEDAEVN